MKRSATQFTVPAAALCAMLAVAHPARGAASALVQAPPAGTRPAPVLVTQAPAAPAPAPAAKAARSPVDRVEARITMLHAKLAITPAQEDLWKAVTQVMRDNAQAMEALTKARADQAPTMTAVDDLKSYAAIAEAHAAGLKQFVPVFEPLYASMSAAQQASANTLFRGHGRSRMAQKKLSKGHGNASPDASKK